MSRLMNACWRVLYFAQFVIVCLTWSTRWIDGKGERAVWNLDFGYFSGAVGLPPTSVSLSTKGKSREVISCKETWKVCQILAWKIFHVKSAFYAVWSRSASTEQAYQDPRLKHNAKMGTALSETHLEREIKFASNFCWAEFINWKLQVSAQGAD